MTPKWPDAQPNQNRMSEPTAIQRRFDSRGRPVKSLPKRGKLRPARASGSTTRGRLRFFSAFLREPFKVGAFWPSSHELAEKIVGGCDLRSRNTIVELGPGTGAFTSLILEQIRRQARFFALELSPINVRELQRRFPGLNVYADTAERLPEYLEQLPAGTPGPHDGAKADCIISGLAWGNMLPATQNRIFDAVYSSLAPGGLFTTFAYVHARWLPTSVRFRQRLFGHFSRIEVTPIVWRNLPPAFVYRCWRDE
jgi:phosphatidylethanolamine/phosphatidyl-N-methylethanolamine N-methyltransferase